MRALQRGTNGNMGKKTKQRKKDSKELSLAHLTDHSTLWKKTRKTTDYSLF